MLPEMALNYSSYMRFQYAVSQSAGDTLMINLCKIDYEVCIMLINYPKVDFRFSSSI